MSFSFLVIENEKSWTKSSVLYLGCDMQSQRKQEPLTENEEFWMRVHLLGIGLRLPFWTVKGPRG